MSAKPLPWPRWLRKHADRLATAVLGPHLDRIRTIGPWLVRPGRRACLFTLASARRVATEMREQGLRTRLALVRP